MPKPPEQTRAPHTELHGTLAALAPKAIALYGIGMRARDLLGELTDFHIAGLLDKDPANQGKTYFGQTVLEADQAVALGVGAIVIAATDVYWHTIAKRIAPWCEANDVAIVFPDGQRPGAGTRALAPLTPSIDRASIEAAIAGHAVISFDLFETLVTRQALRPDDILELAADAASQHCGIDAARMLSARKCAEAECTAANGQHGYPLAAVYDRLVAQHRLSASAAATLQASELAMEISLCRPRPEMLALLAQAQASGKRVWITTDTLLPRETIEAIVQRCALPRLPELLISSETGLSKHGGGLFDVLLARHPQAAIVHIGDNARSDIDQARRHGIAACRVSAPAEQLRASRLAHWEAYARTRSDGQLLGLLSGELFNDPFAHLADGRIHINTLRRFGYVFFGPLLLRYLGWLIAGLQERRVEHLLFFAREGHLLVHLYEKLRTRLEDATLPVGTYFATSRRMSTVAALRTADDAFALLADAFTGSSAQLLHLRYGIEADDVAHDDSLDNTLVAAHQLVARYMDAILANAADERAGYQHYIDRLGIDADAPIAVADLGLKGTIQHALQSMLGRPLQGYYITGWFGEHNPFGLHDTTAALFSQEPDRAQDAVYRFHILCESVLVAPHGMAIHADADGQPVHAPERHNQTLFDHKRELHAGIEAFFDDWLASGASDTSRISLPLIDAIFATAMSDDIDIAPGVRESFFVDEAYRADTERRIWD